MNSREAILLPARAKPTYGSPCNHCGLCCMRELCRAAEMLGPEEKAPCKHLRFVNGDALCGLILVEKTAGLSPLIAGALGAGIGCTMKDKNSTPEQSAALAEKHYALASEIRKNFPPSSGDHLNMLDGLLR